MKTLPSIERVNELLNYDPETGEFTWKTSYNNFVQAGSVAGSLSSNGYIRITIDRRKYPAHRLAWLISYGQDPEVLQVNHINSNRTDNRLSNLELTTQRQNNQHAAEVGGTRNGLPAGVCWSKTEQMYRPKVKTRGKTYNLGGYDDPETASVVYKAAVEALETIMVSVDQIPLLLTNVVEQVIGQQLNFRALRGLPTGVHRRGSRFRAKIHVNRVSTYLGTFGTPEEASAAYQAARAALDNPEGRSV